MLYTSDLAEETSSLEIACEPAAVHAGAGQASQWGRSAVAVATPLLPARVV